MLGLFFGRKIRAGFWVVFFWGGIYQVFEKEIVQEKFSMK